MGYMRASRTLECSRPSAWPNSCAATRKRLYPARRNTGFCLAPEPCAPHRGLLPSRPALCADWWRSGPPVATLAPGSSLGPASALVPPRACAAPSPAASSRLPPPSPERSAPGLPALRAPGLAGTAARPRGGWRVLAPGRPCACAGSQAGSGGQVRTLVRTEAPLLVRIVVAGGGAPEPPVLAPLRGARAEGLAQEGEGEGAGLPLGVATNHSCVCRGRGETYQHRPGQGPPLRPPVRRSSLCRSAPVSHGRGGEAGLTAAHGGGLAAVLPHGQAGQPAPTKTAGSMGSPSSSERSSPASPTHRDPPHPTPAPDEPYPCWDRSHISCHGRSWRWWRTSGSRPGARPWCRRRRTCPRRRKGRCISPHRCFLRR